MKKILFLWRTTGKNSTVVEQKDINAFCKKKQNLDSFTLKGSGDQNFKFDENGRKSLKLVENTMEKGEIARYVPFSFSTVFSKDLYSRHI